MKREVAAAVMLTLLVLGLSTVAFRKPVSATGQSDLNADGIVDISDIQLAGKAFASYPGHARWNPDADMNGDEVVDILDLVLIALDFGSEDHTPPKIQDIFQQPTFNNVYPEDKVEVFATVTDNLSGVKRVTLNYTTNNGTWFTKQMTNTEGNLYNASIPNFPYCTNVTYVITAEDNANHTVTTEEIGHTYKYHVIPEFQWLGLLPLLIAATLMVILLRKRYLQSEKTGLHTPTQTSGTG